MKMDKEEITLELGRPAYKGMVKAMKHPYIKLDCVPDFDNLLIYTCGEYIYRFLKSKKGKTS